jgi:ribonuclease P protein component
VNDLLNSSASGDPGVSPRAASPAKRLATAARLRKRADFDRVYRQGRRHFGAHLSLFFLAGAEGGARVGLTVARALGGAVERNRIKRRLRAAVRLHYPALPPGVDVVINPRKSVLRVEFAELCQEVASAFRAVTQKSATHRS